MCEISLSVTDGLAAASWRPQRQKGQPPSRAKHDLLSAIPMLSSLKITARISKWPQEQGLCIKNNRSSTYNTKIRGRRRIRRRRRFCQTLSVNGDPLDLFDQPLLLDIIFLGTQKLCGGLYILFFFKVSFEKHPSGGPGVWRRGL